MDGAALNAGLICAEQDKHERGSHEHPAGMRTARGPKIDDSTKQVRTANEQTARKPGILLEPVCSGDQDQSAEEPSDRAEVQEQRNQPSGPSGYPLICEGKFLKRSNHETLDPNAVHHCHTSPYDSGYCERHVLPSDLHAPRSSRLAFSDVWFRRLGADPFHEIAAGGGKFELQPLDQFGDRRCVDDLADTLSQAPDVAPRLDLHVAAGAEIHLRLVSDRKSVRNKTCRRDRRTEIVAVHAGEQVRIDDVV